MFYGKLPKNCHHEYIVGLTDSFNDNKMNFTKHKRKSVNKDD